MILISSSDISTSYYCSELSILFSLHSSVIFRSSLPIQFPNSPRDFSSSLSSSPRISSSSPCIQSAFSGTHAGYLIIPFSSLISTISNPSASPVYSSPWSSSYSHCRIPWSLSLYSSSSSHLLLPHPWTIIQYSCSIPILGPLHSPPPPSSKSPELSSNYSSISYSPLTLSSISYLPYPIQ